jgi:ABC-type uncharacterized transport system auxiliary subunit
MRYFNYLFIAVVVVFSGCATHYTAPNSYILSLEQQSVMKDSVETCTQASLEVADVFVPRSLLSRKIYYTVAGLEAYSYAHAEWLERPKELFTNFIQRRVQDAHIFSTVVSYRSQAEGEYLLESRVDEFMQYYDKDLKASYAVAKITFRLIDKKSAKVLKEYYFDKKIDVKTANARGGVEALNSLMNDAVQSLVKWLRKEECRA